MTTVATLVVALDGNVGGFLRSMDIAESRLLRLTGVSSATGAALGAAVAATTAGVAVSLKAFSDFDTAITGVSKTVDATEEQFAALTEEIIGMSKSLPFAATEIAGVAQTAGQLGIEVTNIQKFTKVMLDLGVATDLTANQAAFSIAKLLNVMKTPVDEVDRLASVLVDLGNNTAATEAEILSFARRWAGVAETLGITEAKLLGLSSSLVELGVPSELGGTAVARTFLEMKKAIDDAGEELGKFASISGLTASQFDQLFRSDPVEAFIAFAEGIGRIEAEGGDLVGTLEDVNLQNLRTAETLLKASSGLEQMESNVERATRAWGENTAATIEAEKFYNTFASRIRVYYNNVVDVFRRIGENVGPLLLRVLDGLGDWFESNGPTLQRFAAAVVAVADPLGDLANVVLGLTGESLPFLAAGFVALMLPLSRLPGAATASASALAALGTELKLLWQFGPKNGWGALIGGVGPTGVIVGLTAISVAVDQILRKTSGHGIIDWLFRDPRTADAAAASIATFQERLKLMDFDLNTDLGLVEAENRLKMFQVQFDSILREQERRQQRLSDSPVLTAFIGPQAGSYDPLNRELKETRAEITGLFKLMDSEGVPFDKMVSMLRQLTPELQDAARNGIDEFAAKMEALIQLDIENGIGWDFINQLDATETSGQAAAQGIVAVAQAAADAALSVKELSHSLQSLDTRRIIATQVDLINAIGEATNGNIGEMEAAYGNMLRVVGEEFKRQFDNEKLVQDISDAADTGGWREALKELTSSAKSPKATLTDLQRAIENFMKSRETQAMEAFFRGGPAGLAEKRKEFARLDDEWIKVVENARKAGIELTMIHRELWESIVTEAQNMLQPTTTGLLAALMLRRGANGELGGEVAFNLQNGRQTTDPQVYIEQLIVDPSMAADPSALAAGLATAQQKGTFKDMKAGG